MTETPVSEIPKTLDEAIAAVQASIPALDRSNVASVRSDKGNYQYRYADLGEVTQAIVPLLGRNGLSWVCRPTYQDGAFVLHYMLRHVSGEKIEGWWPLPDPMTKAPQHVGGMLTYARRYALCAVTGLAPGDDDDDAAAAQRQHEYEQQRSRSSNQRSRSTRSGQTRPPAMTAGRPAADANRDAADTPRSVGDSNAGTDQDPQGPLSEQTRGVLMGLFSGAKFDSHSEIDRARRLRACAEIVGHDVLTANDLTEGEGRRIIAGFREHARDTAGWLARLLGEDHDTEDVTDDGDDAGSDQPQHAADGRD